MTKLTLNDAVKLSSFHFLAEKSKKQERKSNETDPCLFISIRFLHFQNFCHSRLFHSRHSRFFSVSEFSKLL